MLICNTYRNNRHNYTPYTPYTPYIAYTHIYTYTHTTPIYLPYDQAALSRMAFYGMGQFLLRRYGYEGYEGSSGAAGSGVGAEGASDGDGKELYCVDTTELGR
jgi:hypothetical protein